MKGRQIVCALAILALGALLGAIPAAAAGPVPAQTLQAAVPVPLPAFLTAPAGQTCAAPVNVLSGVTVGECDDCGSLPPNYCTQCCGRSAACIDYPDGFSACTC
jgi:hypothetical protein